ncbi:lipid-binding SYLF domain-containing protein [Paucidesulfovibrio gracilis]|nr:lipid-binding SYLF domain-containing protein [Paucidesulfovibrio gracilis]
MTDLRETSRYPGFEEALARAEGVLIFPEYFRMAFLGSLAGGSGVLLGRDAFGQWSSPAFYEMGRGGFGMQAGISSGALVYLFFDRDYMLSGLDQGFDLAMDTDVVVFSSVDRTGVSKLATQRPVLLYSEMLGMYAGISFDGGFVRPVAEANAGYYGTTEATPESIVRRWQHWNAEAEPLWQALTVQEIPWEEPISPYKVSSSVD